MGGQRTTRSKFGFSFSMKFQASGFVRLRLWEIKKGYE